MSGDFPDTLKGVSNSRINKNGGLFDFHVFDNFVSVTGNGLGGTSLINASVVVEPDSKVFTEDRRLA